MKITEEVRRFADEQEIAAGLKAKAEEFRQTGGEIYVK